MNNISYRGFNSSALTFKSEAEFAKGDPVTINIQGRCVASTNGDAFVGICVSVRGELITTQMEGYVEVSYSGSAPGYGWTRLCADGNGGVKSTDDATRPFFRVISVDTKNKTVGFIL